MASVVLVSSNPTNLVLSGAFGLSFVKYTAHVILPFLAGAAFVYPLLAFGLFRSPRLIPPSLSAELSEGESGSQMLLDKKGAIFGSVLLLITLAVLVGTSTIGVPVWQVTVPPAVIMVFRDALHDWFYHRPIDTPQGAPEEPEHGEYPLAELTRRKTPSASGAEIRTVDEEVQDENEAELPENDQDVGTSASVPSDTESTHSTIHSPISSLQDTVFYVMKRTKSRFPTVSTIASRLPIALLPFAFLMFILAQGLSTKGWVEVWAKWWDAWICGTNIGATILLARILQTWISTQDVDQRTRDGALYALALGSNYGAFTLTFSASLAGLLWRQILRQKGIHVRPRQFLLLNLTTSFVAMLVSSAVLLGEVYVIDKD
ncbi:hypothetical protein EIP86_010084 [Pleurotus ostreatoroseus]|nr:hypothetical protein EIP86_010084 [Pleurotus ostreatoroseus]